VITIYGHPVSGPSNRVRYTCEYLDVDYEWREIDLQAGEGRREEYLDIHPAGKVPAMEEDDFTLFESRAICEYLVERADSDLMAGENTRDQARVNQWMDFTVQHVYRAVTKVVYNRVFAPEMGKEVDERSLDEGLRWLDRFLPIVDEQLSESSYLALDRLTLADLTLLSTTDYTNLGEISLEDYEHLSDWKRRMESRSFWTACHE
jgi:glutathione S-transferase